MPKGVYARAPLAERFWAKVLKTPTCWLWQGTTVRRGYGQFAISHRDQRPAHRVALELTYGLILPGLIVGHRCDNPPCVNPEHLWIGTSTDNVRDMLRKGRGRKATSQRRAPKLTNEPQELALVMDAADRLRFWAKVDPSGDCWLWTASTLGGYGQVNYKGRRQLAHRLAWLFTNGPIPAGLRCLHTCDTPACVNPEHLFLGTQRDNARDRARKGRGKNPTYIGVAHPGARLTETEVLAIRKATGTFAALARQYHVSETLIRRIKSRERWRHLS